MLLTHWDQALDAERSALRSENRSSSSVAPCPTESALAHGTCSRETPDATAGKCCRCAAGPARVRCQHGAQSPYLRDCESKGVRILYSIPVPPGRAAGGRPVRGRGQCHPRCGAGPDARSARCPRELVTVASAGDQERKECGQA